MMETTKTITLNKQKWEKIFKRKNHSGSSPVITISKNCNVYFNMAIATLIKEKFNLRDLISVDIFLNHKKNTIALKFYEEMAPSRFRLTGNSKKRKENPLNLSCQLGISSLPVKWALITGSIVLEPVWEDEYLIMKLPVAI